MVRAKEIAVKFSHRRPDGLPLTPLFHRQEQDVRQRKNIGMGTINASEEESWMDSLGHKLQSYQKVIHILELVIMKAIGFKHL